MMDVFPLICLLAIVAACRIQQPSIMPGSPPPTRVSRPPTESQAITSLRMITAQLGWALGTQAVLSTRDGGLHWRDVTPHELTHPIHHAQLLSATTAWVITITQRDPPAAIQIFRTSDAGLHWHLTQGSLRSYGLGYPVQITFLDEQYGWIVSTLPPASANPQAFVDVFRTVDGGKTWSYSPQPGLPALGGSDSVVTFLTPTTGWAAGHAPPGEAAYFYVTHDGGSSWERQSLPLAGHHTFGGHWGGLALQPPVFFDGLEGVMLASGLYQPGAPQTPLTVLYVTHDGGTTWQLSATLAVGFATGDFLDVKQMWLTDLHTLYSSDDGGQHWTTVSVAGKTQRVIDSISFVSPDRGWVVEEGPGTATTKSLVRTTDGGLTWSIVHYGIEV